MKITIMALTFAPRKSGGIETYFRTLLHSLQEADQSSQYILVLPQDCLDEVEVKAKNINKVTVKVPVYKNVLRRLKLLTTDYETDLVRQIDSLGGDLFHFPLHVIQPAGLIGKKIISVMDIQEEYWPEFFSKEDLKSRERSHKKSILQADHIITISEFTKQTIVDKYKVDPSLITPIHLSYDESTFKEPASSLSVKLPKKFFYYPAATWPHKNHLRLLEAFKELSSKYTDFHLVLSGIRMQGSDKLHNKISELDMKDRVHLLGYMPGNELPLIYRRAYGLVFPSLFEGFGIPLLEAMASDCPIIASSTTSIPEVAGQAALYFDPLDPKDIASKMEGLINEPGLRKKLVTRGRKRVRMFSEINMAKETIKVYMKVADG
jgi:glycosyltransferase involved in cell wall biosynthesis